MLGGEWASRLSLLAVLGLFVLATGLAIRPNLIWSRQQLSNGEAQESHALSHWAVGLCAWTALHLLLYALSLTLQPSISEPLRFLAPSVKAFLQAGYGMFTLAWLAQLWSLPKTWARWLVFSVSSPLACLGLLHLAAGWPGDDYSFLLLMHWTYHVSFVVGLLGSWRLLGHNQSLTLMGYQSHQLGLLVGVLASHVLVSFVGLGALSSKESVLTNMLTLNLVPWHVSLVGWPIILTYILQLGQVREQWRLQSLTRRITPVPIKRFLHRYYKKSPKHWAESVGLKTSQLMVDHDPERSLEGLLTTGFLQLRTEEILREMLQVSKAQPLFQHTFGSTVTSALDPELPRLPCLDGVRQLSCLYLDTIPKIERSMRQLAELLPILDPDFDRWVDQDKLRSSLAAQRWLFLLDYVWVDQTLVQGAGKQLTYSIQSPRQSMELLEQLRQHRGPTQNAETMLWLSLAARQKLMQESPHVGKLFNALPVDDQQDLLLFGARFEDLIPALQRYHELEQYRVAEHANEEEQHASESWLRILKSRQTTLRSTKEGIAFLEELKAIPLQKEAHAQTGVDMLIALSKQKLDGTEEAETFQRMLKEHILQLEFPGKAYLIAIQKKNALRTMSTLIAMAEDARNRRNYEAWHLLAHLPLDRYAVEEQNRLLTFLQRMVKHCPPIMRRSYVPFLALECVVNLVRSEDFAMDDAAFIDFLSSCTSWLRWARCPSTVWNMYLDKLVAMEMHHPHPFSAGTIGLEAFWLQLEQVMNAWTQSLAKRRDDVQVQSSGLVEPVLSPTQEHQNLMARWEALQKSQRSA